MNPAESAGSSFLRFASMDDGACEVYEQIRKRKGHIKQPYLSTKLSSVRIIKVLLSRFFDLESRLALEEDQMLLLCVGGNLAMRRNFGLDEFFFFCACIGELELELFNLGLGLEKIRVKHHEPCWCIYLLSLLSQLHQLWLTQKLVPLLECQLCGSFYVFARRYRDSCLNDG